MNIHRLKKSLYIALFPLRFDSEKVKKLNQFISKNDSDTDTWKIGGLLSEFVDIIKDFTKDDIQCFFKTIKSWDSYHLVMIADKLLDGDVKSRVKYDLGMIYFKIFLSYEKFDSYYLLDNLELIFSMYNSKLDIETLISIASKIKLLYQNNLISKQQYESNMLFINNLNNDL
jgi:hypothetical protein